MKLLCVASCALVLHGAFASAQSRRLNDPLPRPGAADVTEDFAWSADGAHLVFRADLGVDEAFELFAVPFDGNGPPRRLNAPLVAEGDVVSFVLAGAHVVYLADQDEDQ